MLTVDPKGLRHGFGKVGKIPFLNLPRNCKSQQTHPFSLAGHLRTCSPLSSTGPEVL